MDNTKLSVADGMVVTFDFTALPALIIGSIVKIMPGSSRGPVAGRP